MKPFNFGKKYRTDLEYAFSNLELVQIAIDKAETRIEMLEWSMCFLLIVITSGFIMFFPFRENQNLNRLPDEFFSSIESSDTSPDSFEALHKTIVSGARASTEDIIYQLSWVIAAGFISMGFVLCAIDRSNELNRVALLLLRQAQLHDQTNTETPSAMTRKTSSLHV